MSTCFLPPIARSKSTSDVAPPLFAKLLSFAICFKVADARASRSANVCGTDFVARNKLKLASMKSSGFLLLLLLAPPMFLSKPMAMRTAFNLPSNAFTNRVNESSMDFTAATVSKPLEYSLQLTKLFIALLEALLHVFSMAAEKAKKSPSKSSASTVEVANETISSRNLIDSSLGKTFSDFTNGMKTVDKASVNF